MLYRCPMLPHMGKSACGTTLNWDLHAHYSWMVYSLYCQKGSLIRLSSLQSVAQNHASYSTDWS